MKTGFKCPHCGARIIVTIEEKPQEERIKCLDCRFSQLGTSDYWGEVISCQRDVFSPRSILSYLTPGKKGKIKASKIREAINRCNLFEPKG